MSKYIYVGPPSSVTLKGGLEIALIPQGVIDVDISLPYFKRLMLKGLLRAIPPEVKVKAPETNEQKTEMNQQAAETAPEAETQEMEMEAEAETDAPEAETDADDDAPVNSSRRRRSR